MPLSPAETPQRPIRAGVPVYATVRRRSRYRRLVPVVRALAAPPWRWPEWYIAQRLLLSRRRVRLALSEGAGIWSPDHLARIRAAMRGNACKECTGSSAGGGR